MDGTEYKRAELNCFAGYNRRDEIKCANVERAAQLRIVCALFAGAGMRGLFVFLLMRQILERMVHCVRSPGLLGKQQGEYAQQRQKKSS